MYVLSSIILDKHAVPTKQRSNCILKENLKTDFINPCSNMQ